MKQSRKQSKKVTVLWINWSWSLLIIKEWKWKGS